MYWDVCSVPGRGGGKGLLKGLCITDTPLPKQKKGIGSDERWVVQGGDKVVRAEG